MTQTTKLITKKRKFFEVDIPLTETKFELVGGNIEDLKNKTIKLDLTRQLRGKSIEATFKVQIKNNQAIAYPIKIVLMPYFIRRMIRKRISYIEDSFITPSQESMFKVKPFLITRKKVSRVVRKTLRNLTRNWLEDYLAERKDNEIFEDIFSNKLQKLLSLKLKKTYPLSLCEIRVLEIIRLLQPSEIPKIKEKPKKIQEVNQLAKIEEEKIKEAEEEIEKTQEMALKVEEGKETPEQVIKEIEAIKNLGSLGKETEEFPEKKKPKKSSKKTTKKKAEE